MKGELRQVLICGSRKTQGKDGFERLTREISRRLVRDTDWRIVTGGYGTLRDPLTTVDELAVSGAPRERVITVIPEDHAGNKYFRHGRTIVVPDASPRERRAKMVQLADVVLAIGGGAGTADIINTAYAADKPLLPLAFTGGAAREVWERYRALLIKRYSLTTAEIAAIEKGGANQTVLVGKIIGILDRMSVAREAPAPRLKIRKTTRKQAKRPRDGKLRLLIASPNDVKKERAIVREVVGQINRGVAADRRIEFQVVAWETDTYPGFHPLGPQGLIADLLRIEDCDIVVGVFWKRFGGQPRKRKSGTEQEIRTAVAAWKKRKKPHVMLYFSTKEYSPKDASETKQWTRVLQFRGEFQDKEALVGVYATQRQFEDDLRDHLTLFVRTNYRLR